MPTNTPMIVAETQPMTETRIVLTSPTNMARPCVLSFV